MCKQWKYKKKLSRRFLTETDRYLEHILLFFLFKKKYILPRF